MSSISNFKFISRLFSQLTASHVCRPASRAHALLRGPSSFVLLLLHAHHTTPQTRGAPQRQQPSSPLFCTRTLKHAMTFDPGATIPLLFVRTRKRRSSTRAPQSHSSASALRHDDLDPGAHHPTHQACIRYQLPVYIVPLHRS